MREVVFIVPRKDNDGVSLTPEIKRIERELLDLVGGFTVESVRGAWREGRKTYRDESFRYTVATEDVVRLVARVGKWGEWLRQQAMYVSVREVEAQVIEVARGAA